MDNNYKLQEHLWNTIFESIIEDINIDLFNEKIIIKTIKNDGNDKCNHLLEIYDCSNFLFVGESCDLRKWNYYEVTDIILGDTAIRTDDKWLKQYPLKFNIVIEIWETALLIKANAIKIDGIEYQIFFNRYGRKNVGFVCGDDRFGKEENDFKYLALKTAYEDKKLIETLGDDFEVTDENSPGGTSVKRKYIFKSVYTAVAEYYIYFDTIKYTVRMSKNIKGKWQVDETIISEVKQ